MNKVGSVLAKNGFKVVEKRSMRPNVCALGLQDNQGDSVGTVEVLFHGGRRSPFVITSTVAISKQSQQGLTNQIMHKTKNFECFEKTMQEIVKKRKAEQLKNSTYLWNFVNYFWN
jgi:hypothetical protein